MGGGLGRRSPGDNAAECALTAKEVGRPTKLIWTREEDTVQRLFRPQSFQRLEAATDVAAKVIGWKHSVVGEGEFLRITGVRIPYADVPNQQSGWGALAPAARRSAGFWCEGDETLSELRWQPVDVR